MNLDIKDKVAIVTGASKGMGFSTVESLVQNGVKVMMVSRNKENLVAASNNFNSNGYTSDYTVGDVSDQNLPEKVVTKTLKKWGSIDILINNAGGPPLGHLEEVDEQIWQKTIETNLMSVVRFTKSVIPQMKKCNWGRIISITSTLAIEPTPSMILSSTVRAAVSAFTKALSIEVASKNISINVICPGGVLTERLENLLKTRSKRENINYKKLLLESEKSIPARRFAQPSEIGNIISFLCSEKGAYINGVSLAVDGSLLKSF